MTKPPMQPLTKDEVFSFILETWGRGAFKGFTKHILPEEYEEWLTLNIHPRRTTLKDLIDIDFLPE